MQAITIFNPVFYTVGYSIGGIFLLFRIIAWWRIFKKADERGWKSLIPFYNYYTQIKISWSTKFFWLLIAFLFLFVVSYTIFATNYIPNQQLAFLPGVCSVASLVFSFGFIAMFIAGEYWLCRSFGHGWGWTIGLLFFNPLFILMLGFGKSKYQGIVY